MSRRRQHPLLLIAALSACAAAGADDGGYAIGVGLAFDNADGIGASALIDYSFNDRASVSASYASTRASAAPDDITTRDWSVGARYDFGPLGFDIAGGQSGDPDDFDSNDLSAGIFHSGDHWQLSARYLQRDIDLVLRFALIQDAPEFSVPLEADGYRLSARFRADNGVSVGANTRSYDYDRDLSPLSGRFIVQRLSPTTLTLSSSLLERSDALDVEFPLSDGRAINFQYARDRLAGGLGDVDSVSAGYLTPAGSRGDLDLSVGISRGDGPFDDDDSVFFSVLYLFYGGFD